MGLSVANSSLIHGLIQFKQRHDFTAKWNPDEEHVKNCTLENQWGSGPSGNGKPSGPPGWRGGHTPRELSFSANLSCWLLKLIWGNILETGLVRFGMMGFYSCVTLGQLRYFSASVSSPVSWGCLSTWLGCSEDNNIGLFWGSKYPKH